jgi:hypothetical protein
VLVPPTSTPILNLRGGASEPIVSVSRYALLLDLELQSAGISNICTAGSLKSCLHAVGLNRLQLHDPATVINADGKCVPATTPDTYQPHKIRPSDKLSAKLSLAR